MGNKYTQDGVNIEEGDDFSSFAYQIFRKTYDFNPLASVKNFSRGNFRGPRGIVPADFLPKGCAIATAPDGIGTKVSIIDAANAYPFAANDVVAMTGTDISRWGGVPIAFSNVFDVSSLGEKGDPTNIAARQAMFGLLNAADKGRFILVGGETAELGICVGSENPDATLKFNWAGFMLGLYHESKMILGDTLTEGMIIMALKENGFRSNGISSVRAALRARYGEKWWENPESADDIRACAEPSVLYDPFLNAMNGWHNCDPFPTFTEEIKMHLIVHLSGGAFKSKLGEDILFPLGLSAEVDNLFDPPEIMAKCRKWRGLSESEGYEVWNGGQGVAVVIEEKDEKRFIDRAADFGHIAQKCGRIVKKTRPSVVIQSRFGSGKPIVFKPKEA